MWIVDVGAQRNPIKYTAVEKRAKENEHKELPSFFIYILFFMFSYFPHPHFFCICLATYRIL